MKIGIDRNRFCDQQIMFLKLDHLAEERGIDPNKSARDY